MTPLAYDRAFVWHPYASLQDPPPVRHIVRASGVELVCADGLRLIDAVSSWWCVAHGHNHPALVSALRHQSEKLCHVMFGGLTHDPAIELAQRLAHLAPPSLNRVFFADSGSIAVEVAAKMAIQYHHALGHPERHRLVALKGGYHGDTSLCMALSDPDGMHTLFKGLMTSQYFAEKPRCPFGGVWEAADSQSLAGLLDERGSEIAAVICEPIFQAANAMHFYHPAYLQEMKSLCQAHGVLLIFDEIAAGFYRTGPLWAQHHAHVVPDIMTVGKALTGGHITLAATLASESVADVISHGSPSAFMHGPTYMANPLACAVACASLDLFEKTNYAEKVSRIEKQFRRLLEPARAFEFVRDVRILGAVAVIELKAPPCRVALERVIKTHGVWLRPFCNYVYAMPPLISDAPTIERIAQALLDLALCPPDRDAPQDSFHE